MKRSILVLGVIFLVLFPYLAYSITTLVIQETEKLSVETKAADPDNDALSVAYEKPLDEKGEWQTTYGDAGEYKTRVTVSDGLANDTEEVLIIVKRKEEPPVIEIFIPKDEPITIKETESVKFHVTATDLNKDMLSYYWFLDGTKVMEGQDYAYTTSYRDSGSHKVKIIVSDGIFNVSASKTVNVEDVDVQKLLDGIEDVVVDENEIARLKLPNFKKLGLAFTISEPIGNDNEWQTTYDDAGSYDVEVEAEGNGFEGSTEVKVIVNDVDRTPVFDKIGSKVLDENDEIKITLNAHDLDGDEVTFSAENLPKGANFDGNVFTWKTDYDTVTKDDFVDRIMDKFRVLSKSFYVKFIASSKEKKVVQNVILTVRDINRQPVLEDLPPITINEGETLRIVPNAYDLDGDKVSFKYSGFVNADTYKSNFDDAGTYFVKVIASDGMLEASKFVEVNIKESNRLPLFEKIQDVKSREGDSVAIVLNAYDPDGDEVAYSVDNPPDGASLKDNVFLWQPGFDVASKGSSKKLDLVFTASDGQAVATQIANLEVIDRNRAPRIIDATKGASARVNEPVTMFVDAIDDDGDVLTYTWDFGLLEKYEATENHQRTFTTPGAKSVKVIASDGIDEAEQTINVFVEGMPKPIFPEVNQTVSVKMHKVNVTYKKETKINKIYKIKAPKGTVVMTREIKTEAI